jgi:hypothetical protein
MALEWTAKLVSYFCGFFVLRTLLPIHQIAQLYVTQTYNSNATCKWRQKQRRERRSRPKIRGLVVLGLLTDSSCKTKSYGRAKTHL